MDMYFSDIKYLGISNYIEINQAALKEMKGKFVNLHLNAYGVAKMGIIVRHLVFVNEFGKFGKIFEL
ncbi:MAG: hypothetical protein LBL77_01690 [Endomicrobium sp.]|jgi:uncharacterized Fe-S radical SAM superfamily protein PflX|nr:hypothetical protein [Endomicrobium sp.]